MSKSNGADDSVVRKRHENSALNHEHDQDTLEQTTTAQNINEGILTNSGDNAEKQSNNKVSNSEKENRDTPKTNEKGQRFNWVYIPKRWIVTFLSGLGLLLVYSMRTNVGVMVVMILDERAYEKVGTIDAMLHIPRVNWDSRMVGFLHSVFYIGFLISQIPGAFLTTILPSHKLYGGCILTSAILNILLPICINNGQFSLVCCVRCVQGLAEGLLYPACYDVLRHWTAPSERSRQVSAVLSCAYAGAIVGFPLAGIITHYLGWEYIFYTFGCFCIIWYLFWWCLIYEKPSHHKYISEVEFEFMEKSQGADVIEYENVHVPWKSIITSLPVISICVCHFVRYWIFVLMLTNEAVYLNEFGFTIAETGLYASFPHIAKVVLSFASGYIADCLLNYKCLSTGTVRKLLTGIGLGIQAVGFVVLAFLVNGSVAVAILTVTVGAFGITTSGWSVNHYDLSTRYASSLVAVTSAVGSLGAIIVPLVTGNLTVEQTIESWDNVFYLTSSLIVFAVVFYLIFGSGEQQHWSHPPANICLIQKIDPLARKPYGTYTVQKNTGSGNTDTQAPSDSAINRPFNMYTVQANTESEDKTVELDNADVDNAKSVSECKDGNDITNEPVEHDVHEVSDKVMSEINKQ